MDRKDFLRKATLVSGGIASGFYISGCDGNGGGSGIVGPGSGNGGNGSGNGGVSYDDWNPDSDNPYFSRDFYRKTDTSNSHGRVEFSRRKDNRIYSFFLEKGPVDPVEGLEARLFIEDINDKGFLSISDPQRRYMPHLHIPRSLSKSNERSSVSDSQFVRVSPITVANYILNDIYVSKFESELPSPTFDSNRVVNTPGTIYLGSWSIDDLTKTTNIAKNASLIASPADGGVSYAILSKVGFIGELLGSVVDGVNRIWPESEKYIARDKKYPIYTSSNFSKDLLLMLYERTAPRKTEEDIKYMLPINEGNSWTYTDGRRNDTLKAIGTKRIKGKNLAVVENVSGGKEYFGVSGNSWKQYGLNIPSIGDVFFDPAIELGDNHMKIGKNYSTKSNIISPDSGISGSMDLNLECVARDDITLPNGSPYGDCFRVKETASINIERNGQVNSEDFEAEHLYAKNVGKVQIKSGDQRVWLTDKNIVANTKMVSEHLEGFRNFPSLSNKIIETYRRIS
ncbi:MAG: hypothetical protein WDZ69_02085 [Candidatus Pacearchaeota archaeon]